MNDVTSDENCNVTASTPGQFVERIERLEAGKKGIADQIEEVNAETRAHGVHHHHYPAVAV
ncbi:MAG: DUF2312 domain-containing protein [Roseovarius sp.]